MSRRLRIEDVGDRRRFTVTCLDADDDPADPSAVTITARSPAGVESAKTWLLAGGGDAEVVRAAAGTFHREVLFTEAGDWTILAQSFDADGQKEAEELKVHVRTPVVGRSAAP